MNLRAALERLDEDLDVQNVVLDSAGELHGDARESWPTDGEWYDWNKRFGVVLAEATKVLGPPHVDSQCTQHEANWEPEISVFGAWLRNREWIYVGLFTRSSSFDWVVGIEVGRVPDCACWT